MRNLGFRAKNLSGFENLIGFHILIFFMSCGTHKENIDYNTEGLYEIIVSRTYNSSALFHKTISSTDISHLRFDYESLNTYNFNKSWVLERERFVNFDTIFNPKQRKEIDDKLKSLKILKLDPDRLKNPGILYLEGKSDKIGLEKISFPFIQEGKDGNLYGFIYRENPTEGIFFIYKLVNRKWVEFAKVQLWIA